MINIFFTCIFLNSIGKISNKNGLTICLDQASLIVGQTLTRLTLPPARDEPGTTLFSNIEENKMVSDHGTIKGFRPKAGKH